MILLADVPAYAVAGGAVAGFLGVLVACGSLVFAIRRGGRDDDSDARNEALALAETRKQRIDDLEEQVMGLRKARQDDRELHDKQIRSLREEMGALEARFNAASREYAAAQALMARSMTDLIVTAIQYLEADPPGVPAALDLLRSYANPKGAT